MIARFSEILPVERILEILVVKLLRYFKANGNISIEQNDENLLHINYSDRIEDQLLPTILESRCKL